MKAAPEALPLTDHKVVSSQLSSKALVATQLVVTALLAVPLADSCVSSPDEARYNQQSLQGKETIRNLICPAQPQLTMDRCLACKKTCHCAPAVYMHIIVYNII